MTRNQRSGLLLALLSLLSCFLVQPSFSEDAPDPLASLLQAADPSLPLATRYEMLQTGLRLTLPELLVRLKTLSEAQRTSQQDHVTTLRELETSRQELERSDNKSQEAENRIAELEQLSSEQQQRLVDRQTQIDNLTQQLATANASSASSKSSLSSLAQLTQVQAEQITDEHEARLAAERLVPIVGVASAIGAAVLAAAITYLVDHASPSAAK
jgi:septal ring factor EnvC (AmiA/AmiB activator)